jgi:succinate dehydrogenase / fumarate reductase cytochrome b subunit
MPDTIAQKSKRPLSPHLQVYKLPLTALMSISHRLTGIGLIIGTLIVTGFFLAAASGPDAYNMVLDFAETIYGKIILVLWSAGLYYHMCNGVRHMIWDTGALLSLPAARTANFVVLTAAALLTIGTWVMACGCWRGM